MRYYVTGSNIFRQWPCEHRILNKFSIMESKHKSEKKCLKPENLIQINWSYNILHLENNFYISGAWDGKEDQFVSIPLPIDIVDNLSKELIVLGNDYNLVIASKNTNTLWIIDLKKEKEPKKISLTIEEPIENGVKRQKVTTSISKVVLFDESCLYLTSLGDVYSGILPSCIDTRHCRGKICDIQCGYEHYLLLTDVGIVYTWGNGRRLQLGHGDVSNLEIPTEVEALAGIKITKISSGGWHSLALSEFGDLYAWGWNDTGQLGIKHEDQESYSVPTLVNLFDENGQEILLNVKDLACGSRHSAILLEDHSIWTSGCNKYGQLGFSEQEYPTVNCFKKSFHCDNKCILLCGPWTTVIFCS